MSNFFFTNQNTYKELPIETPKCNKHICLDPDESRTFHQGKSFRFFKWEDNKDRYFLNDEFYQDFVSVDRKLYVCINSTSEKPGASENWQMLLLGEGEDGLTPFIKMENNQIYVSYDKKNWNLIGSVDWDWGEY